LGGDNFVTHQALSKTDGNSLIKMELKRIERYTEKGDILPINKIWEYLLNRDKD